MGRNTGRTVAKEARQKSGVNYDLNKNKVAAAADAAQRITRAGDGMTGQLFLQTPTGPGSAARLTDVEGRINRTGDGMTGQLFLQAPTGPGSAARQTDVDTRITRAGDGMEGQLFLQAPTGLGSAVRLTDLNTAAGERISRAGDAMNAPLSGPQPTAASHYARKAESDAAHVAANNAQVAANSADANANGRIANAADTVTAGHIAPGAVASSEINDVLNNPGATTFGLRTTNNVAGGAAPFLHVHSISFKHLPREERRSILKLRREVEDGAGIENVRRLALALAHLAFDDADLSAEDREKLLDRDDEEARRYKNHHAVDDWEHEEAEQAPVPHKHKEIA